MVIGPDRIKDEIYHMRGTSYLVCHEICGDPYFIKIRSTYRDDVYRYLKIETGRVEIWNEDRTFFMAAVNQWRTSQSMKDFFYDVLSTITAYTFIDKKEIENLTNGCD